MNNIGFINSSFLNLKIVKFTRVYIRPHKKNYCSKMKIFAAYFISSHLLKYPTNMSVSAITITYRMCMYITSLSVRVFAASSLVLRSKRHTHINARFLSWIVPEFDCSAVPVKMILVYTITLQRYIANCIALICNQKWFTLQFERVVK